MLLYKIFFFNVNMYFFINLCRGGTWSNCLYYLVPTEDQTNASNISKLKQRSTKSDVKKNKYPVPSLFLYDNVQAYKSKTE